MNKRTTAGALRIRRRKLHPTEQALGTYYDTVRQRMNGLQDVANVEFVKLDLAPETTRRLYPSRLDRLALAIRSLFKWS